MLPAADIGDQQLKAWANLQLARAALAEIESDLQTLGVAEIWLYGSRARGDDTAVSDWDLLTDFFYPITPRELGVLKTVLTLAIRGTIQISSPQYQSPEDPGFLLRIRGDCQLIWSFPDALRN